MQHLENWLLVITFSVMVIAIFIQVVNRNIFKIPVSGFEEAAKYCITGVVEKFHGKARKALQIISKLIVVCFAGVMTNTSYNMVMKQVRTGQTSPGLGIPMSIPYFALLLSFALITVIQGVVLVRMILDFNKPEQAVTAAKEED